MTANREFFKVGLVARNNTNFHASQSYVDLFTYHCNTYHDVFTTFYCSLDKCH